MFDDNDGGDSDDGDFWWLLWVTTDIDGQKRFSFLGFFITLLILAAILAVVYLATS